MDRKRLTQSSLHFCLQAGEWNIRNTASNLCVPFPNEYLKSRVFESWYLRSNTVIWVLWFKKPLNCIGSEAKEDVPGEEKHFWGKKRKLRMSCI